MAEVPSVEEIMKGGTTNIFPFLTSDKEVVKTHYRKLLVKYHPDKLSPKTREILRNNSQLTPCELYDLIKRAYNDYIRFIKTIPSFCKYCSTNFLDGQKIISVLSQEFHIDCWKKCGYDITMSYLLNNDFVSFDKYFFFLESNRNKAYLAYLDKKWGMVGHKSIIPLLFKHFAGETQYFNIREGIEYLEI